MTAMQVTATQGGSTFNGIMLRVKVLTGVAGVQNGATAQLSSSSGPDRVSITTTVTGSEVYGALAVGVETAWTVQAGTTIIDNYDDPTNGNRYGSCKTTAVTGTPGATLVGTSFPTTGGFYNMAAMEVLPDGTIQEDPSGPALAAIQSAKTVTTAAFDPPEGSLLVAMVGSNGGGGSVTTMSVSGGGLNWTEVAAGNSFPGLYSGVWIAVAAPPDPNDPPITCTETGATSQGILARIKVLTGAAPAALQTGATATQSAAAAHQASITTTQAGSIVYGAVSDGVNNSFTAAASTTLFDNVADGTNGCHYGTLRTTAVTGTPGAVTVGASAPSDAGGCALAEILPATPGGTITEDASSPAAVSVLTQITVTVNVTPPAGSLLVLMVASDGGAGVTSLTVSGGGLTWRALAQAHASSQQYNGVWVADIPVVLAAPGLQPPEPPRYLPGKRPGMPFLEPFVPWPPWEQSALPDAPPAAAPAPAVPQRPAIISRAAARARVGPSGRSGGGIAGPQPAAVTTLPAAPPAALAAITRPVPARARVGPGANRSAGGVASAIVTPLGQPSRPRPFVFRSPAPARARTGPAGSPGDGNPSSVVTPLGSMPRPMPRPVIQHLPPRRGHAGPSGQPGAGLASSTVTPLGTPGPQWRPPPRRPAPSRAVWHGGAAPPAVAAVVTAYQRPPAQFPRRPAARASWHGGPSSIVTPRGTPGPSWRAQPRRPAPSRAVWHGNAGPAAVAPAAPQAYQRPAPQIQRPGPARAVAGHSRTGGGQAGGANAAPVTTAVVRPPAQPRSRPPQRAVWHGNASHVVTPLGTAARRPGPVTTSKPRSRGLWHGGTGPPPPPASAAPPRWRPLPSRRRPARGTWRTVRGTANAQPPAFSIGALTATDASGSVLTAAGASSALTASTAARSTLTAGDQRTGGPGG